MKKAKYNLPPRWKVGRESNYTLKTRANQEWNGYSDRLSGVQGGVEEGWRATIRFYL